MLYLYYPNLPTANASRRSARDHRSSGECEEGGLGREGINIYIHIHIYIYTYICTISNM